MPYTARVMPFHRQAASLALVGLLLSPALAGAQSAEPYPRQPSAPAPPQGIIICTSQPGERALCAADTSAGVALVRSTGKAPCLLGESWGYDKTGIWVSDGCSGAFAAGQALQQFEQQKQKAPAYIPNAGFLLYTGEKGEIYFVFSATSAISINATSTTPTPTPSATRRPCSRGRTCSSRSSSRRSAAGS